MTRRDCLRIAAVGVSERLASSADLTLSGAGASFPGPIYEKWFHSFSKRFPGHSVSYKSVGSGEGLDLLAKGAVDFAGCDHPASKEDQARMPFPIRHVPTVVGGVVPICRLDDLAQPIRFTPEILAGIYLGKIRRWNDPALRAVNHGAPLPAADIAVVHRSDRSGTTFVWTEYLSGVSAEWKSAIGAGDQVKWPVEGLPVKRSAGMLEAVASTPNSLGYVEFVYALDQRLNATEIRNRAGKFVRADLSTLAAAANTATTEGFAGAGDAHVNITDAPGAESYPVAAFTYLLIPRKSNDESKDAALQELVRWILTSGQKQCSALGYAALPAEVASQALKSLSIAN